MRLVQAVGEPAARSDPGRSARSRARAARPPRRSRPRRRTGPRQAARRAPLGGDLIVGDHQHRLDALGRLQPHRRGLARPRPAAEHEPAVERGRDVVGMALDLGGVREQISRAPAPARKGGPRPSARRRSLRRSSPARAPSGISLRIPKSRPSAGCSHSNARTHRFERSAGTSRPPTSTENSPVLLHLQLQVQRQRRGEDVVARPEVGRGGRDANEAAARGHRSRPAAGTPSSST